MPYTVSRARPEDVPALPAIELAAGVLLEDYAPPSVLLQVTPEADFIAAQAARRLWVARDGDTPVGFALVELLDDGLPHLEEIDVLPAHGRRGVGTSLVRAVCAWTSQAGFPEITLTTYRAVPWNMPFYARMGFVPIAAADLRPALAAVVRYEAERGLDPERRVVMCWRAH